jgi:hypothetical protein
MTKQHIILGCPKLVREIIRSTYLHGFEKPQVLNTEGERCKEVRRGVPIAGKYGAEGEDGREGERGIDHGLITGK